MKRFTSLALLTVVTLSSAVAVAQDNEAGGKGAAKAGGAAKAAPATGEDGVQYKAKTFYDFDDDSVTGDLQRPDGEDLRVTTAVKHESLIEIRKDFIPEMLKSLEDL